MLLLVMYWFSGPVEIPGGAAGAVGIAQLLEVGAFAGRASERVDVALGGRGHGPGGLVPKVSGTEDVSISGTRS